MKYPDIIDFRSDTVTKPTKPMLEAMFNAKVGDDVFEEDPTIKALEEKAASMFGKEAALFCSSGTMTNQIAIKIQTQPGQEIVFEKDSHVYYAEGGGVAFNSGLSMRMISGDRGRIKAEDVIENINPDNVHAPITSLVSLENTSNKGGGSCYDIETIRSIADACQSHGLKLHLDGARIFNAIIASSYSATEIGKPFDSISVCLSKGLGAPVGSVLISTKENIKEARRVRKVFGGGMRQAGFLAAAGIYALDHNISRLKDDHSRARAIGNTLTKLSFVEEVLPVETNIILFRITNKISTDDFINKLAAHNIKAAPFGKQIIRMVTHIEINDDMVEHTLSVLQKF